jgi:hypothetical protein
MITKSPDHVHPPNPVEVAEDEGMPARRPPRVEVPAKGDLEHGPESEDASLPAVSQDPDAPDGEEAIAGWWGLAEDFDICFDDPWWQTQHSSRRRECEAFAPAYRPGYNGRPRYGLEGRTFDEAEQLLFSECDEAGAGYCWEQVREWALAEWDYVENRQHPLPLYA